MLAEKMDGWMSGCFNASLPGWAATPIKSDVMENVTIDFDAKDHLGWGNPYCYCCLYDCGISVDVADSIQIINFIVNSIVNSATSREYSKLKKFEIAIWVMA